MKTYVLEYIVYTRIVDGMLVSERKEYVRKHYKEL